MPKFTYMASGHWHHHFDLVQYSTGDFYTLVEEALRNRHLPDLHIARARYVEKHILSAKREYLSINYKEYIFDVCAAPFGHDFFVSWWVSEKVSLIRLLLMRIPLVGRILGTLRINKTYFQADTEQMFRDCVHRAVLEAIDKMTQEKGVRGLNDMDRQSMAVKQNQGLAELLS